MIARFRRRVQTDSWGERKVQKRRSRDVEMHPKERGEAWL